jgi:hypothetical protein
MTDLPPPRKRSRQDKSGSPYSEEYLLEHLRLLTRHYRRRPTAVDLMHWRWTHDSVGPTEGPYITTFDSLPQARVRAGVDEILEELGLKMRQRKS